MLMFADTGIDSSDAIARKEFNEGVFEEYLDKMAYTPFMGTNSEAIIHVNEDLSRKKGDAVTFNFEEALDGEGVEGDSTMEGNEEQLNYFGQQVVLNRFKNAVRTRGKLSDQRFAFEIMGRLRPALTRWLAQKGESKISDAYSAVASGLIYGDASAAQRNTWHDNNSDRVLYGASTANFVAGDHAASLANVDGTNDILSTGIISLAKRLAQRSNPKIRPIKIEGGEEWYLMFVDELASRDLKEGTAWQQAQREAQLRGRDNPIFTGMLGTWDGVILKEAPKTLNLAGVGAGSINVANNVLVGAQSILWAQGGEDGGQQVSMVEEKFDYGNKTGVQIASMYEVEKAFFNDKQHGVISVYTSAVAD